MSGKTKHWYKKPLMRTLSVRLLLIFLLVPLWIFLRSVYRDRIAAFGCFDDCLPIMAGYFIESGKKLYSQIYFNHQLMPAYISAVIQILTKPASLYMLMYEHRMVLIYFFMLADVLLVLRFGLVGFGFALLYETTKGFLFGDRFLAESMIIYPLVYLFGIAWELMRGKKISPLDVWISTNLTWFVVFSREPYVPLAILLFSTIVWYVRKTIWGRWAIILFILMSLGTVLLNSPADFWFNVVTINVVAAGSNEIASSHLLGSGMLRVIFYPFLVFFTGTWSIFRWIEIVISALYLTFSAFLIFTNKKFLKPVLFSFILLAFANLRIVPPGQQYYEAFHHIEWYGIAIMSVLFLIQEQILTKRLRIIGIFGIVVFTGLVLYALVVPGSYLHEKVDRQSEFNTNYAQVYIVGEVIRLLSDKQDTVFLDEWEDLIYWQSKLYSPYRYSWYTSNMPNFEIYRRARDDMFAHTPPTFYFGKCAGMAGEAVSLPQSVQSLYVRLLQSGRPSCVWVRKEKIPQDSG